jgi:phage terminase large subunit-like protein
MDDPRKLLRTSFVHFYVQYFSARHPGAELLLLPFVRYICDVYQNLESGDRLVINQPPRTGKTVTVGAYVLWSIGRDPTERIVFLSNNIRLAEEHVYEARKIMQSAWYKATFKKTRIAEDRSGLKNLRTTEGGGFFAGSMKSSLGGVGATKIIIDDGNRIDDANDPEALEDVNNKFDGEILSRLNPIGKKKRRGIIVNVQHRLAANDLSAHLITEGFKRIAFALEAPRTKTYRWEDETWTREVGHVLLENYSMEHLEKLRGLQTPPYFYFYQQGLGRSVVNHLKLTDFRLRDRRSSRGPFVISVDAAQTDNGSFNVAQVWDVAALPWHLRTQFRAQCGFFEFEKEVKRLIRRFRPGAILVENAANGPALVSDLRERLPSSNFILIDPQGSKAQRLSRHCKAIAAGEISLQETEISWLDNYICEFTQFPRLGSDQVDATTQLLDWRPGDHKLVPSATYAAVAVGTLASTMQPIRPTTVAFPSKTPGIALALKRPFFRKY